MNEAPDINTSLFQAVSSVKFSKVPRNGNIEVYDLKLDPCLGFPRAALMHVKIERNSDGIHWTDAGSPTLSYYVSDALRETENRLGYTLNLGAYVMQGCPGAGKSRLLQEFPPMYCPLSADDFFNVYDGFGRLRYVFDPTLLGQAHALCRLKAIDFIRKAENVIVDNTHCGPGDLAETVEYLLRASERLACITGCVPLVVVVTLEPDADVEGYAQMCAARNTHGVPLQGVRRMTLNLANDARVRNPLTAYRARR